MANDELVIDCDGHILEPPDLWERYLDPKCRDRVLRVRVDSDGFGHLLIDGRPSTIARPGQLATLGSMDKGVQLLFGCDRTRKTLARTAPRESAAA